MKVTNNEEQFLYEDARQADSIPCVTVGQIGEHSPDFKLDVAVLKDFLCIKLPQVEKRNFKDIITVIMIFSLKTKKFERFEFNSYPHMVKSWCVAIEECMPLTLLRQTAISEFEETEFTRVCNQFQLTRDSKGNNLF